MAPAPNLLDLIFPAPDRVRLRIPLVPFLGGYRSRQGEGLRVWSDPSNSITAQSDPPEIDPPSPSKWSCLIWKIEAQIQLCVQKEKSRRSWRGCSRWLSNLRVRGGDKWYERQWERQTGRKRELRTTTVTNPLIPQTSTHSLQLPCCL